MKRLIWRNKWENYARGVHIRIRLVTI